MASLRQLRARAKDTPLKVTIFAENGSRNRSLLSNEIVSILREAGIDAAGESGTSFPEGALPPIEVVLSEKTVDVGNALVGVLGRFVKANFSGTKRDLPSGEVQINIYGEPQFDDAGVAYFR